MLKDINLIPDRIIYRKTFFLAKLGKVLGIIISILILTMLLLIVPYKRWELENQVAELTQRVETPELKELNEMEKKVAAANKDFTDFEALLKKVPQKSIRTTDLIKGITSKMPSTITASEIVYNPETKQLTLTLNAKKPEDVPLFLKRLHDDSQFADVNISEIQTSESLYRFSVILKLK